MRRAERAQIYRDAALLIERNEWDRSCWAVAIAEHGRLDDTPDKTSVRAYARFMLGGIQNSLDWEPYHPDYRGHRVIK